MTALADNLPYSPVGLERLAVALGVDSAMIWLSPSKGRLEIREITPHQQTSAVEESPLDELEE